MKFYESKEEKLHGLFIFRESKKKLRKTPDGLFHKFSLPSPKKYKIILRRTLLTKVFKVFLFRKQFDETEKEINYHSTHVLSNSL
jgi:hypothetical protein